MSASPDLDEVPGTVRLVDIGQQHTTPAQHDAHHHDIVLVPRPSADPEDPLNWTYRRKLLAVGMAYLYVFGTGIAASLQYSVLCEIEKDTGISIPDLVQGTGVMFLFLGYACLVWQPLALTYGRRGVYLITMLLATPMMVWTAYSSTAGEWYGHRVLIGIIISPIESLCEVTVYDLFFAHNRGTYMSLYVLVLFGSNFIAPLFAGWFNDAYGWRWTMHLGAIICAVCFVIMFLFTEETMYFRDNTIASQDAVHASVATDLLSTGKTEHKNTVTVLTLARSSQNSIAPDPINRGWSKYSLFKALPGRPSNADMLRMAYRPILMIFHFPTVAWAGFLYGVNLAWFMVLNGTVGPVLSQAPYNWSPALVGSAYAGPIVGAVLAWVWSGTVADRIALRLARRNGGIREAEHRLWVLVVSGVVSAAGLILWGVGAYHDIHWLGLMFGLGMLTFGCVTGGSVAVSYNVDCFKHIAGETTVSIMLVRNTIGFGFGYAISPWWTTQGLQNCFVAAGMISIACTLTFIIFIVYGKRIRRWSIPAYKKYMASGVMMHE